FNPSTSAAVVFSLQPAANSPCSNTDNHAFPNPADNGATNIHDSRTDTCTDAQTFQVIVPTGALYISTPYHAGNPFDLGRMTLAADGTSYHAQAAFGTAANPANGVTIIDTRGGLPWTASVLSSPFTSGAHSINPCNLGFTGVAPGYITGNAISASNPIV